MQSNLKHIDLQRAGYARLYSAVFAAWDAYDDEGNLYEDDDAIEKHRVATRETFTTAVFLTQSEKIEDAIDNLYWATTHLWIRAGKTWGDVQKELFLALEDFVFEARRELGLRKLEKGSYEKYRRKLDRFSVK